MGAGRRYPHGGMKSEHPESTVSARYVIGSPSDSTQFHIACISDRSPADLKCTGRSGQAQIFPITTLSTATLPQNKTCLFARKRNFVCLCSFMCVCEVGRMYLWHNCFAETALWQDRSIRMSTEASCTGLGTNQLQSNYGKSNPTEPSTNSSHIKSSCPKNRRKSNQIMI